MHLCIHRRGASECVVSDRLPDWVRQATYYSNQQQYLVQVSDGILWGMSEIQLGDINSNSYTKEEDDSENARYRSSGNPVQDDPVENSVRSVRSLSSSVPTKRRGESTYTANPVLRFLRTMTRASAIAVSAAACDRVIS